jgi:hypothetical protein
VSQVIVEFKRHMMAPAPTAPVPAQQLRRAGEHRLEIWRIIERICTSTVPPPLGKLARRVEIGARQLVEFETAHRLAPEELRELIGDVAARAIFRPVKPFRFAAEPQSNPSHPESNR